MEYDEESLDSAEYIEKSLDSAEYTEESLSSAEYDEESLDFVEYDEEPLDSAECDEKTEPERFWTVRALMCAASRANLKSWIKEAPPVRAS